MKLVVIDNTKYKNINDSILEDKKVVVISDKKLKELNEKSHLKYNYLYSTSDFTIYNKNNNFVSYAFSKDDMIMYLLDINDLNMDDVIYIEKENNKNKQLVKRNKK